MVELVSNRRIVKNTLLLYVRMIFVMAVGLYTSRLVLDALGVEDYGLYTVVGGIVALFAIINNALSAGTSRFITYELGKGEVERLKNTFSAAFAIHAFIAIVVLVLAETVGLWYVNNILVVPVGRIGVANWLYQFAVMASMLSLTQVPYSASIIAHERMGVYAYVGIVEAIFKLIMVIYLTRVKEADRLLFYGAILCIWNVCLQIFYRVYCKRNFVEGTLRLVIDKSYYKSMISFSLWDMLGSMCVTGYSQGVNLLINFFFGVAVNAARGIAMQVENAMTQFSNNFTVAVGPQITKLFSVGETKRMMDLVRGSSRYSFILLATISLPMFVEADYVLGLWLKEVPEFSVVFLRWLILCNLVRGYARPVVQAVHASGNIKWLNLYAGGTSMCLNLPLAYVCYLFGGPPYSCYIICFCINIICNYLELIVLKREVDFSIMKFTKDVYIRGIIIAGMSLTAMYGVYCLISIHPFILLILVCLTSVIVMGIGTYIIGMDKQDRGKVVAFVKSKIR